MKYFTLILSQLYIVLLSKAELLPSIPLSSLSQTEINAEILKDSGGKIGAFVVNHMDSAYQEALRTFMNQAPECLKQNNLPHLEMNDGSFRTTYAKVAEEPSLQCLESETEIIDKYFDIIDEFVAKLIEAETGTVQYQVNDKTFRYTGFFFFVKVVITPTKPLRISFSLGYRIYLINCRHIASYA